MMSYYPKNKIKENILAMHKTQYGINRAIKRKEGNWMKNEYDVIDRSMVSTIICICIIIICNKWFIISNDAMNLLS